MKFRENRKIRIALILILMICLGITSGLAWNKIKDNTHILAASKPITTRIKKQKDVPLLISAAFADTNALKPTYGYSLTNVNDKTIRAFAIQSDVFYGSGNYKQSGATFSHLTSNKQLLRPNESRQESEGNNTTYPEEVNEIVLSV
ncbi:MAG TPA: hypothetical protein VNI84_16255 [Pyrinomonadaceae bacterium]|nr:hypothetical protein [Pyrinomonadaceae bacterium]